ncbi:MAG: class I SAM-dependent methyltransferase [Candidatus Bathyarchaeota archaeon]|nr:class I SAM-dependent methyltransferase [Candidatus Bathyarchaeota archaeon]
MNKNEFYEKEEVVETLIDSDRSKKAFEILKAIISNFSARELKILDLGCGTGEFMNMVASLDEKVKVWGVDVSSLAVSKVREKGFESFVVDVNWQKLPFPKRFFDIIYLGDVIEHLLDPDFMIKEVKRTLRAGGFLVLTTPNLASWHNRLLLLFGVQPVFSEVSTKKVFGRPGNKVVGHLRLYTLRSLKDFLSHYGFDTMKIEGAQFHTFSSFLAIVDRLFSHLPSFSSIMIVVAQSKTGK